MLSEPNPQFVAAHDDAELEWLLCLASAVQARNQQTAKAAATPQAPPEATLFQELKELLKGLRRPERTRAA